MDNDLYLLLRSQSISEDLIALFQTNQILTVPVFMSATVVDISEVLQVEYTGALLFYNQFHQTLSQTLSEEIKNELMACKIPEQLHAYFRGIDNIRNITESQLISAGCNACIAQILIVNIISPYCSEENKCERSDTMEQSDDEDDDGDDDDDDGDDDCLMHESTFDFFYDAKRLRLNGYIERTQFPSFCVKYQLKRKHVQNNRYIYQYVWMSQQYEVLNGGLRGTLDTIFSRVKI